MDVSKCHACHANSRGVPAPHLKPSAPPEPAQCHKCHTCHARVSCVTTSCVWASGVMTSCVWASCVWASCARAPLLPRETKMDVSKCHGCHANSRGVPAPHLKPSALPEPAQCHKCHTCHARVQVDVTKYHACQVKRRWMSPSATPATPTAAASRRHT